MFVHDMPMHGTTHKFVAAEDVTEGSLRLSPNRLFVQGINASGISRR